MEQQKKKKRAVAFGLVAVVLIFWNLMQNTADQQKLKEIHGTGRKKISDR